MASKNDYNHNDDACYGGVYYGGACYESYNTINHLLYLYMKPMTHQILMEMKLTPIEMSEWLMQQLNFDAHVILNTPEIYIKNNHNTNGLEFIKY